MKVAKGNPGRRPIGVDADASDSSARVDAPVWLEGEALVIWRRIAPRLVSLRLLSVTDAETFARYCRDFARWLKMQKRLDELGEIYEIETASGVVRRPDPAFLISHHLGRRLEATEDRFGLNPAERQRIFAARAAAPGGADRDLFGNPSAPKKGKAAKPAPAPSRPKSAVGYLQ